METQPRSSGGDVNANAFHELEETIALQPNSCLTYFLGLGEFVGGEVTVIPNRPGASDEVA